MRVSIKVFPRAHREGIVKNADGSLKVYLTEAPTDGRANKALIGILADRYDVKKSGVRIVKGETSHNKIVEIDGNYQRRNI